MNQVRYDIQLDERAMISDKVRYDMKPGEI